MKYINYYCLCVYNDNTEKYELLLYNNNDRY